MKIKFTGHPIIQHPSAIADVFHAILEAEPAHDKDKEHFWCAGLSTRNHIKYIELVSLGTLNSSLVHPRELFRFAIMQGTANIICCHNHPSGDTEPSEDDLRLTARMKECGHLLGIEVLDHIIIGNNTPATGKNYLSMKERGLI